MRYVVPIHTEMLETTEPSNNSSFFYLAFYLYFSVTIVKLTHSNKRKSIALDSFKMLVTRSDTLFPCLDIKMVVKEKISRQEFFASVIKNIYSKKYKKTYNVFITFPIAFCSYYRIMRS